MRLLFDRFLLGGGRRVFGGGCGRFQVAARVCRRLIVGGNAVRVIVSGLLQEHAGAEFVRGQWHEGLGVAMVLLGLGLIVGLAVTVGLIVVAGIVLNPNVFNSFFVAFHSLFFEGDSWLFLYSDTLIRLFPLRFWQDAFLWAAVIALGGGIALALGIKPSI